MTAVYRVWQGLRALFAFLRPVDTELAAGYLSPEQMTLFDTMRHSEQVHALDVLRDVLAQAATPDDLATAALLHDVGKARYHLQVWQKTIAVLLQTFTPGRYARWSVDDGGQNFWRRPLVVKANHPPWGAQMLAGTGTSERALWLIEHHQDTPEQWHDHPHFSLLRRLQQADDAN